MSQDIAVKDIAGVDVVGRGLSGEAARSAGFLRAHTEGPALIDASNDIEAVRSFLAEYEGAKETYRAYEKECVRLVLWAAEKKGKSISSLSREDFAEFEAFLGSPEPASEWCGPKRPRYRTDGTRNPEWKPFVGGLSPSSRRMAMVVVKALLNYLVDANYLSANPLRLERRTKARKGAGAAHVASSLVDRYLDVVQVEAIFSTLDEMPEASAKQRVQKTRARWVVDLMLGVGARIHEPGNMVMGNVQRVRESDRWQIRLVGKGGRADTLPLSLAVMESLIEYRRAMGWSDLPFKGDDKPLVADLSGRRGLTSRRLHQILSPVFGSAATLLEGKGDRERADGLRKATPHWLRHTSITRFADRAAAMRLSPKIVQKFGRHRWFETTAGYIHADDEAMQSVMHEDADGRAGGAR